MPARPRATAAPAAGRVLAGLAVWAPVTAFLGFTLFPVYWLVNSSLKGPGELFTFPPRYWPAAATAANYLDAIRQTRLGALYLNSLWVSSVTCLVLMALIVFSGYAMARFRFRGKAWLIAPSSWPRCCPTSCSSCPSSPCSGRSGS